MKKELITCLDHIITLEENRMTQNKLLISLNLKINKLAVPKKLKEPIKKEAYYPNITYNLKNTKFNGDIVRGILVLGAVIAGIYCFATSSFFSALVSLIVAVPVGAGIGALVGAIIASFCSATNENINATAHKNACDESKRQYDEMNAQYEEEYQEELRKYNTMVEDDKERVKAEAVVKEELISTRNALENKMKSTVNLLNQFYDAANIYETYRNIIAVCHINEYLKSGVCTDLIGKDGAYMTYKYEMYEKLKIERLDTIIEKLDQLHFDNIILIKSIKRVADKVDELTCAIDRMKDEYVASSIRQEKILSGISNQISGIDDQMNKIISQNSVIEYNTECTASEARLSNWLTSIYLV